MFFVGNHLSKVVGGDEHIHAHLYKCDTPSNYNEVSQDHEADGFNSTPDAVVTLLALVAFVHCDGLNQLFGLVKHRRKSLRVRQHHRQAVC